MVTASLEEIDEDLRRMKPISPPDEERAELAAFSRFLQPLRKKRPSVYRLVGPKGELPVPESVFHVLVRVAEVLARGDAITVVPVGKELTTQQAADLLNVSRQYLIRLLDEERLPYRRTGKHRRLRIEDVLAFKQKRERERKAALDELTELSEELGGYPELK